ncbi:MAG: DNA mismatch repair endonuclease MutL [Thermoanaerobaculia bacterium]|nr:MAG: DNA mismatch repair endonuclease MutL [Thermoanaerobaculia bacterium]MBZ0101634.1 DNA mismatch repair endonuclease MutL [Thermoanaerobaculia bacterium]
MPSIRILPDTLVSQIAAGEVVERPASVLKELIENALDAGATRLEIELEGGGATRVRLADDGCGMERDDSLLAFDRHATSKIATFDDLERVASLGFRGEALASIAAVAKVELLTARQDGEGTRVRIEGGRVLVAEPAARRRGTTIDVRSLFWNVPARRKFLKRRETELRRAVEVAEGYALARPDVGLELRSDGRLLLDTPAAPPTTAGEEALRSRIGQIFGAELVAALAPIESREVGASGFVGSPATARGRRSFVFVNRRLVRDRAVLAAFYRAVRDEWRSEEFPSLFLFLELSPDRVDVNVHPQKAEVRFRDFRTVERVGEALRAALARARGEEPAPLRAPATGRLDPALLAWEGLGGRGGSADEVREPAAAQSLEARGQGLFVQNQDQDESQDLLLKGVAGEATGTRSWQRGAPGALEDGPPSDHGGPAAATAAEPPSPPFSESFSSLSLSSSSTEESSSLSSTERLSSFPAGGTAARGGELGRIALPFFAPPAGGVVPLSGRSGQVRPFRLLGQYKGALILLEGPDGLYLIDQHVAHERVYYERFRRTLAAATPMRQGLVTPLLLDLARSERLRLAALSPALDRLGFEVEELSGGTLAVAAAPVPLGPEEARALLLRLATDGEATPENLVTRVLEDFAASLACKAAIKMHHSLSIEKCEALISELFRAENPYACPHGRPVVLTLPDAELERRFGRR